LDAILKVIGRRDHAHVDVPRLRAADPFEIAVPAAFGPSSPLALEIVAGTELTAPQRMEELRPGRGVGDSGVRFLAVGPGRARIRSGSSGAADRRWRLERRLQPRKSHTASR
jgi:hypothetical protein